MSEVQCVNCGALNRTTARFCAECGKPLLGDSSSAGEQGAQEQRDAPALAQGTILQGRYRIEHELGRGGFGAVYQAWDNNLSRACAVKENLDTSVEAQRQFTREATVLANLSHPNLPRVTDHFIIPEQGQYLVMDFVEGDDLAGLLQLQGALPLSRAMGWGIQVADALEYLHSQNPPVFHRDIKPANIRITPQGRAMLVDFGLVKVSDPHLKTTVGARAVTPGYAPPEQYGRGSTDARTDLYALSATMYSMLTGREPLESVQRISGQWLAPAQQVNPRVPQQIGQVIERGMALDPRQRYQSAAEFKASLQTALKTPGATSSTPPVGRTVVVEPAGASGVRPMRGSTVAQPVPVAPSARVPRKSTASSAIPKVAIIGGLVLLVLAAGVVIGVIGWVVNAQQVATQKTETAARQATFTQVALFQQATQTEQAGATATLFARSTATAESILAATNAARATSTARAAETATALAWPTLTVQARAQATEQAWEGIASTVGISPARTLVYGPEDGSLAHEPDDGYVEVLDADVSESDVVVEAWFVVPYSTSTGDWDFGFIFRWEDGYNNLRIIIESDGDWKLSHVTGNSSDYDFEDLDSGTVSSLRTNSGDPNKVVLIAKGSSGWLFVNDVYITSLDLSEHTGSGDVMVATGLIKGREVVNKTTEYQGFTIWSLP